MTIKDEFSPAKKSIRWAENAIAEFNTISATFFQGNVTEIVTEFDPQSGDNVQKVRLIEPIPDQLFKTATDALIYSKHSFDQATFAARNIVSGRSNKSVYFPWARTPTDLERLLKSRGIDQRLWDTFSAHQPYPRGDTYAGGDDSIRTLARMANDKHTVGLSVASTLVRTQFPRVCGGPGKKNLRILTPRWDPKKNEAEMIRWTGNVDISGDYNLSFEIVFQDP